MNERQGAVLGLGPSGFHRVAYTEWGSPDNARVVVCVHGLTRNGRDFDFLARELAGEYRVICPDVVGRGRSDWLPAAEQYQYPQYLADMAVLLARTGVRQVDWIGTSMGGLIGMMLAAQPRSPIRRLVLNDVGPRLPLGAIERIRNYVGKVNGFASLAALETDLRRIFSGFGSLTDAQWRHLARHSARQTASGVEYAYDPAIAGSLQDIDSDIELWPVWGAVQQPVLVLRGRESDILDAQTARRMCARAPTTRLLEFAGVGHAPALANPEQIDAVRAWLLADA